MILGVLTFIGIVAIPYGLMRAEIMTYGTFEIFVFVDIVLGVGLIRAFLTRVRDSAWL